MNDVQLLVLLDQVIRTMPESEKLFGLSSDVLEWFGRDRAILQQWNPVKPVRFGSAADTLRSSSSLSFDAPFGQVQHLA
jgi:hypothetical protein